MFNLINKIKIKAFLTLHEYTLIIQPHFQKSTWCTGKSVSFAEFPHRAYSFLNSLLHVKFACVII